ncbi:GNAT family N-acetyltransferase, partial [Xenorhabdus bovienii]|nr:GNAT family N-acetyltransferase [Xenorhabdus bovienii]
HPNIVSFLDKRLAGQFCFYIKKTESGIKGACFSFKEKNLIENMQTRYPIPYDEIAFPIAADAKIFLPVNSNRLSPIHKDKFI